MSATTVRGGDEILLAFTRALRAGGVPVTQDRAHDFLTAAALLGADDPGAVRVAGRSTLCAGPDDLARFVPIAGVDLPASPVYLLTEVETGKEFQGVRPDDALPVILARGRSPLTLEEGLAVVTHHPGILRGQTCFEMLGSRCGDKRVTGLWVSAERPRLGWCWGGNPHTWLGMASCAGRLGE